MLLLFLLLLNNESLNEGTMFSEMYHQGINGVLAEAESWVVITIIHHQISLHFSVFPQSPVVHVKQTGGHQVRE